MDKNSSHYMKSSYESSFYGNDSYTTLERNFDISGKNRDEVRAATPGVMRSVMP